MLLGIFPHPPLACLSGHSDPRKQEGTNVFTRRENKQRNIWPQPKDLTVGLLLKLLHDTWGELASLCILQSRTEISCNYRLFHSGDIWYNQRFSKRLIKGNTAVCRNHQDLTRSDLQVIDGSCADISVWQTHCCMENKKGINGLIWKDDNWKQKIQG